MIEQAFEKVPESATKTDLIEALGNLHQRIATAQAVGAFSNGDRARFHSATEKLAEQIAARLTGAPVAGTDDDRCPRCRNRLDNPPGRGAEAFCRRCGLWLYRTRDDGRLVEFRTNRKRP